MFPLVLEMSGKRKMQELHGHLFLMTRDPIQLVVSPSIPIIQTLFGSEQAKIWVGVILDMGMVFIVLTTGVIRGPIWV